MVNSNDKMKQALLKFEEHLNNISSEDFAAKYQHAKSLSNNKGISIKDFLKMETYQVLKEVSFENRWYHPGETIVTALPVVGLMNKGIIKKTRHHRDLNPKDHEPGQHDNHNTIVPRYHPLQQPSELSGDIDHRWKYGERPNYETPLPEPTLPATAQVGQMMLDAPLAEPAIIKDILKEHYPQAKLNIAQDVADNAIKAAAHTVQKTKTRKPKNTEMTNSMTDLVETTEEVASQNNADKIIKKVARKKAAAITK
mgnify:FL=1